MCENPDIPKKDTSINIEPDPREVRHARKLVKETLSNKVSEKDTYTAALLTSELVTNSIIHAKTPITVNIRFIDSCLCISVMDKNPLLPEPKDVPLDAQGGRGLSIVGKTASSWGTTPTSDGKMVWFCLQVHPLDKLNALPCPQAGACDALSTLYSEDPSVINNVLNRYIHTLKHVAANMQKYPPEVTRAYKFLKDLDIPNQLNIQSVVPHIRLREKRQYILNQIAHSLQVLEAVPMTDLYSPREVKECVKLRSTLLGKLLSKVTPKSKSDTK